MEKRRISVICFDVVKIAVLFSVSLHPLSPAFAGWDNKIMASDSLDETELRDLKKRCKEKQENQQQEKWSEREKRVEHLLKCNATLTLNAKKYYLFDKEINKAILYSENPNILIEFSFLEKDENSIFEIKGDDTTKEDKNKVYQEEEECFYDILSHKKSRIFQKEKHQPEERWNSRRFSQDFSGSDTEDEINEDDIAFMEVTGLSKAELKEQRCALENLQNPTPVIEEKIVKNNNSHSTFSNIETSQNRLFVSDFQPMKNSYKPLTNNNKALSDRKEYTVKRNLFPQFEMTKEDYGQSGFELEAFGGFMSPSEREKTTLITNTPITNKKQLFDIKQETKDLKALEDKEKREEKSNDNNRFNTSTSTSSAPVFFGGEEFKELTQQFQDLAKKGF